MKPIPSQGWRMPIQWMLIAGRGMGDAKEVMTRRCSSLEAGRHEGRELLRKGWEWCWVKERI